MARQAGDGWPKAKIEMLRQMADAGHKAANVAVRLATSRSAVLGKAKRLGIRFTGQAVPVPPQLAVELGAPSVLMPSGATLMLIPGDIEVALTARPAEKRVDVVMALPDPESASAFHAELIIETAARAELPSTKLVLLPDVDEPGQAKAVEVAADFPATALPEGVKPGDVYTEIAVPAHLLPSEPTLTPKGWPKPAGPRAVTLQDLREHHCRMPLWADSERSGLFCGEATEFGQSYCAACRPLIADARQSRSVQERAANSARFAAAGRSGAFA